MCHVVKGQAVRFENDHIIQIAIFEDHIAMELIMDDRFAIKRHGKAHGPGETSGFIGSSLFSREIATMVIVAWRQFFGFLLFAHLFKAFGCAVAGIGMTGFDKLVCIVLIQCLPLYLIIGAVGTTDH